MWTSFYVEQYLPEEGYAAMELPTEVFNRTGVHVEYVSVSSAQRSENFSVLIASDDLLDIMCSARSFYNGVWKDAILEEKYFANLWDYRQYLPNYLYQVTKDGDKDTIKSCIEEKGLITDIRELKAVLELTSGGFIRGDWLEDMGISNKDINTFDDLHNVLTFFKIEENCENPTTILSTIELSNTYEFVGYDTLPCCAGIRTQYVYNGQVCLSNTTERDKELMTMLNQWFTEGLIDPNWMSYDNIPAIGDQLLTGKMGYISGTRATTMLSNASAIPEGETRGWEAVHRPLKYEGQTLHLGFYVSHTYWGSAAISSTCENIPLACTWIDWRYSPEGEFLYGYGVQGLTWDYNENGDVVISDFIRNHEAGWTMIMLIYALNSIVEPGLYVNYAYNAPGNEIALDYLAQWDNVAHDNAYVYPSVITFTAEQNDILAQYGSDLESYLSENYLQFVDGSKPLSEWDSYVAELNKIGLDQVLAVYQSAYDDFLKS